MKRIGRLYDTVSLVLFLKIQFFRRSPFGDITSVDMMWLRSWLPEMTTSFTGPCPCDAMKSSRPRPIVLFRMKTWDTSWPGPFGSRSIVARRVSVNVLRSMITPVAATSEMPCRPLRANVESWIHTFVVVSCTKRATYTKSPYVSVTVTWSSSMPSTPSIRNPCCFSFFGSYARSLTDKFSAGITAKGVLYDHELWRGPR